MRYVIKFLAQYQCKLTQSYDFYNLIGQRTTLEVIFTAAITNKTHGGIMLETNSSINLTSKEKIFHGDIFLPVSRYHTVLDKIHFELIPHWHDEMEITLISEGTATYRVYTNSLNVKTGDLVLVSPHFLHSAKINSENPMISESLVFHINYLGALEQDFSALKYLQPLLNGQFEIKPVIHPEDPGYEQLTKTFSDALNTFLKKDLYYELHLKIQLLEFVLLLFQFHYITESSNPDTEQGVRFQIHQTLDYIHHHYTETLSIKDLAKSAGFSESYFMYLFKEYVGMTCVSYINHYRIQKAAQQLESSKKTILEIAIEHGFDNISYFNRRFKSQFGMTPKEYRIQTNHAF